MMRQDIIIHEVGLRDGLQIEKQTVPMEKKIEWVEGLLAAGIGMVQLGSFVNPEKYGVLVATNLFGDIISDLCAQMIGGLGFGCSGNIGEKLAVFEPTHGSAPKYAGQYKVNPIATILAAKMMLDWLGEKDMAVRLEKATAAVIQEGKVRTYDMGGASKTLEMAEAIAAKL